MLRFGRRLAKVAKNMRFELSDRRYAHYKRTTRSLRRLSARNCTPGRVLLHKRAISSRPERVDRVEGAQSAAKATAAEAIPPFPVRTAVVATAAGLGTPLFALAGISGAWFRYKPRSPQGILLKYGSAVAFGCGGYTFIVRHLAPFLLHHGELLLPFALSNMASVAVSYAALEWYFGFEAIASGRIPQGTWVASALGKVGLARLPAAGLAIGAVSSLSTVFFWPLAIRCCWPPELQAAVLGADMQLSWLGDVYFALFLPVGLPIGLIAGAGLHQLLHGTLTGASGQPWTGQAGLLLLAMLLCGVAYFKLCSSSVTDMYWEARFDTSTSEPYSFNTRNGVSEPGWRRANDSALYRAAIHVLSRIDFGGLYALWTNGWMNGAGAIEEKEHKSSPEPERPFAVPQPERWADVADSDVQVSWIRAHQSLQSLTDLIVCLKRCETGASSTEEKIALTNGLQDTARGLFQVDLKRTVGALEALVVAKRAGNTVEMEEITQHMVSTCAVSRKGTPSALSSSPAFVTNRPRGGSEAVRVLVANVDLVADRWIREIAYTVPSKMLQAQRTVRRVDKARSAAYTVGALAGAGLLGYVAYLATAGRR